MKLPEPVGRPFSVLIPEIEKGEIKIPQFQREFVWDIKKSAKLMDSIIKGYPIGTFIFWRTNERLRSIRNLGNFVLPELSQTEFVNYVLDGQQRLTTLFAALKGLTIERNGKIENFADIYIDLEANEEEDDDIVVIEKADFDSGAFIKLKDLLYGELTLLTKYDTKYHSKLSEYKARIQSYNYSIVLIREAPLDVATEIFTRINEGGKPLTVFEIMIAKTFDSERDFDLAQKYKRLVERLTDVDYETIPDATVLQTVSILLQQECNKKTILKLNKKKFIDIWDDAVGAIEAAVEYFRNYYRVPVSQLLPFNALIVPFAYFFYHHKDKPTGDKQKYLQDFFWRVSLGTRYSSGVEGKLAQDIRKIDAILKGELPRYEWAVDTSTDFIKNNGGFSASRSYIKALLSLYAYFQPKSFIDDSSVNISNYWLKQANSKNYHHFFPRAYLNKKIGGWEDRDFWINHILNITIVDDFLNKREIAAKAPGQYMKTFARKNPILSETMKSHLINDLDKFGIWNNDYESFLEARAKAVSRELKKRVIEQEVDRTLSAELDEEGANESEPDRVGVDS